MGYVYIYISYAITLFINSLKHFFPHYVKIKKGFSIYADTDAMGFSSSLPLKIGF